MYMYMYLLAYSMSEYPRMSQLIHDIPGPSMDAIQSWAAPCQSIHEYHFYSIPGLSVDGNQSLVRMWFTYNENDLK